MKYEYGPIETEYLIKKDATLGRYIREIGMVEYEIIPGLFPALVHSIIGQQISTKAHHTIWRRMCEKMGGACKVTPQNIMACTEEEIQSLGTTMRKVRYIRQAAMKVISGELDLEALNDLPDNEVCQKLSVLNGIGIWTAEMLMTFCMQRKDIFSFDDLAIQRALRMVYRHRHITREIFEKYRRRFSPYGSIASLYLWHISAGHCGLTDPAPRKKIQAKTRTKVKAITKIGSKAGARVKKRVSLFR